MPARSNAQRKLMGMVYAYKKGKLRDASDKVKEVAKHISKEDARDFAATKSKGLPEKKAGAITQAQRISALMKIAENPFWDNVQDNLGFDSLFPGHKDYSDGHTDISASSYKAEPRSEIKAWDPYAKLKPPSYSAESQLEGGAQTALTLGASSAASTGLNTLIGGVTGAIRGYNNDGLRGALVNGITNASSGALSGLKGIMGTASDVGNNAADATIALIKDFNDL